MNTLGLENDHVIPLYSWKHCMRVTNHRSLTDSTWQLQMPSKDSVNFLVSKDWNVPLSAGLQNPSSNWPYQALPEFARKNWGGSTNRMPVWQQKFVSQPPDQIIPNWGVSKNKILLPKIFGRRVRPLVQCIPSQPCPGHCCCAQEWVRCSETLKQIYILCIPLHVPERSCTHWRTHTQWSLVSGEHHRAYSTNKWNHMDMDTNQWPSSRQSSPVRQLQLYRIFQAFHQGHSVRQYSGQCANGQPLVCSAEPTQCTGGFCSHPATQLVLGGWRILGSFRRLGRVSMMCR